MSNTRAITAIIAFVVTFIFSAGLVRIIFPAPVVNYVYTERPRTFERSNNAIEEFIRKDESNGDARMYNRSSRDYADAVTEYWKASSSMDASRFPQDFQNAWSLHMKAWGDYAKYLQDKKSSNNRKSVELEKYHNSEISRTWEEVLSIGRSYGANVY